MYESEVDGVEQLKEFQAQYLAVNEWGPKPHELSPITERTEPASDLSSPEGHDSTRDEDYEDESTVIMTQYDGPLLPRILCTNEEDYFADSDSDEKAYDYGGDDEDQEDVTRKQDGEEDQGRGDRGKNKENKGKEKSMESIKREKVFLVDDPEESDSSEDDITAILSLSNNSCESLDDTTVPRPLALRHTIRLATSSSLPVQLRSVSTGQGSVQNPTNTVMVAETSSALSDQTYDSDSDDSSSTSLEEEVEGNEGLLDDQGKKKPGYRRTVVTGKYPWCGGERAVLRKRLDPHSWGQKSIRHMKSEADVDVSAKYLDKGKVEAKWEEVKYKDHPHEKGNVSRGITFAKVKGKENQRKPRADKAEFETIEGCEEKNASPKLLKHLKTKPSCQSHKHWWVFDDACLRAFRALHPNFSEKKDDEETTTDHSKPILPCKIDDGAHQRESKQFFEMFLLCRALGIQSNLFTNKKGCPSYRGTMLREADEKKKMIMREEKEALCRLREALIDMVCQDGECFGVDADLDVADTEDSDHDEHHCGDPRNCLNKELCRRRPKIFCVPKTDHEHLTIDKISPDIAKGQYHTQGATTGTIVRDLGLEPDQDLLRQIQSEWQQAQAFTDHPESNDEQPGRLSPCSFLALSRGCRRWDEGLVYGATQPEIVYDDRLSDPPYIRDAEQKLAEAKIPIGDDREVENKSPKKQYREEKSFEQAMTLMQREPHHGFIDDDEVTYCDSDDHQDDVFRGYEDDETFFPNEEVLSQYDEEDGDAMTGAYPVPENPQMLRTSEDHYARQMKRERSKARYYGRHCQEEQSEGLSRFLAIDIPDNSDAFAAAGPSEGTATQVSPVLDREFETLLTLDRMLPGNHTGLLKIAGLYRRTITEMVSQEVQRHKFLEDQQDVLSEVQDLLRMVVYGKEVAAVRAQAQDQPQDHASMRSLPVFVDIRKQTNQQSFESDHPTETHHYLSSQELCPENNNDDEDPSDDEAEEYGMQILSQALFHVQELQRVQNSLQKTLENQLIELTEITHTIHQTKQQIRNLTVR